MKEIILATSNSGKISELAAILAPVQCISQASLGIKSVEENGLSFIENALLKARHASRLSGRPALADDSGLVVDALQGAPGIYSARYAGIGASDKENWQKLLQDLQGVPQGQRQASFYCVIALVQYADDPIPLIACGRLSGVIAEIPAGTHGFGYDPVFYLASHQCTAAELPTATKNTISHRAKALLQLQQQLGSLCHDA